MEDIHVHPFFRELENSQKSLLEQLFEGKDWMFCLPKAETLEKGKVDKELISSHILKPEQDKKQFKTLTGRVATVNDVSVKLVGTRVNCSLLYTETYYDDDFRSFIILHIDQPLIASAVPSSRRGSMGTKGGGRVFPVPVERRTRKENELFLQAILGVRWKDAQAYLTRFLDQFNQGLVDTRRIEMNEVAQAIKGASQHILTRHVPGYGSKEISGTMSNFHKDIQVSLIACLLHSIYPSLIKHTSKLKGHKEANHAINSMFQYVGRVDMSILKIKPELHCQPSAAIAILGELKNVTSPAAKLACVQDSLWMLNRCLEHKYQSMSARVGTVEIRFKKRPFGIVVAQTNDAKRSLRPGPLRCTRRRSLDVMRNVYFSRFHGYHFCPTLRGIRKEAFEAALETPNSKLEPDPPNLEGKQEVNQETMQKGLRNIPQVGWRLIAVNGIQVRGLQQSQLLSICAEASLPATLTFRHPLPPPPVAPSSPPPPGPIGKSSLSRKTQTPPRVRRKTSHERKPPTVRSQSQPPPPPMMPPPPSPGKGGGGEFGGAGKPVLTADDQVVILVWMLARAQIPHLFTDLQLILNLPPSYPITEPPLAHTAATLHAAVSLTLSGKLPTPDQQKLLAFLLSDHFETPEQAPESEQQAPESEQQASESEQAPESPGSAPGFPKPAAGFAESETGISEKAPRFSKEGPRFPGSNGVKMGEGKREARGTSPTSRSMSMIKTQGSRDRSVRSMSVFSVKTLTLENLSVGSESILDPLGVLGN